MAELRVVRPTDRFEEGCRFYGELLGWPVVKEWGEPGPGRIFGFGQSARVELLHVEDGQAEVCSGVHVGVEVDDVSAVHDAITDAGIKVTAVLADQPWGHRNFAVADPTGMTVVFFQVTE